jgi:pilus assembly protein CpaB
VAGISLSRRGIALVVAVVLAAVATVALVSYVQSAHNKGLAHPVTAYVAKQNIAAGTDAASIISQGLIETKTVEASTVPPDAIKSLNDIQGKRAAINLSQNEIILTTRFVSPTEAGQIAGAPLLNIPVGFQAISVEVSTIPGVANFIQAGDTVSVIAQVTVPTGPNPGAFVKYLLQNVKVLQVGQRVIVPPANGQPGGAAVQQVAGKVDLTLAVSPGQAEKLTLATLQGTLYFTLVPQGQKAAITSGRTAKNEFGK